MCSFPQDRKRTPITGRKLLLAGNCWNQMVFALEQRNSGLINFCHNGFLDF